MLYNFDFPKQQSPVYLNNQSQQNNGTLKNVSTQKSLSQIFNFDQTNDFKKKLLPLLNNKLKQRNSTRIALQSPRLLQLQSDNSCDDQNKRAIRRQLPSIYLKQSNNTKSNCSQDKLSLSPQKQELNQLSKRVFTDGTDNYESNKLSLRKLNELLNSHYLKIPQPTAIQRFPEVQELQDLPKQMELIFKRNNINPIKMKANLKYYSPREKKNTTQSIDSLIKLLKK
ncbi:unnamed protein product (macronuclear) [Paramecium tetraurelia]|uniref:Uncharacterized protein n=1 Tax=Paramecium tetraurelia TaxID=5888 RepID=A0BWX2_PARTE|nr:uncharacterized protein GSPATT00032891001 [Paramecium tetraurelia]CAK63039.1 unnamed protein product [Paramecium tetraurelia]|eukprot:XP_001430437.1 hypothetical protein (macronuclear) [Paramecium tetraurelia strain d4-2]